MSYATAAKAYRRTNVQTASKTKVLDELFARLLRDCAEARTSIQAQDYARKGAAVNHGLRITTELIAALDHKIAPALCRNLQDLYEFIIERMMAGNQSMETARFEEAERVVRILQSAFREAALRAPEAAP